MNSFRHQYMIVHLDDEFFPLLEKALKPYNQYEECKTDVDPDKKLFYALLFSE